MQRILGNSYGQLIYDTLWESDMTSEDPLRFCYRDHEHPEYPKLATGDVNGKLFWYIQNILNWLLEISVVSLLYPEVGVVNSKIG